MAKHLPKVDPLAELPVHYEDRRLAVPVYDFQEGVKIYTHGVPVSMEEDEEGAVTIEMDGIGGSFLVKFVKISAFYKRIFSKARRVLLWGTPKQKDGRWCIYHPDVLKHEDVGFIAPVYKGRTLISEQRLRSHVWGSTKHLMETIVDEVPVDVLRRRGLPTIREALVQIHKPRALPDEKPILRLAYREMWELKQRILGYERDPAPVIKADIAPFYDLFPFEFTKGQKQTIADIMSDMSTGRAMRRFCWGEVGAGKTEVAMAAAYLVSRCGYRSLILSPTTVLAAQTYEKFQMRLGKSSVSLFTGEVKESPSMILVGTHAMLNRKFSGVALCVHDESQKFGVEQRNELIENAHGLQMSATPLPRSMGLLLHGAIDISLLGECPFQRDVVTKVVPKKETPRILQHMKSVLTQGGKALVIYPLVSAEHKLYKSVENVRGVWEQLYPGQVTYVHGQLEDKLDIIDEFRADPQKKVLVATSLVEAGIDIPEALFLVVAGAERYGITQLHQIRGRIGRRGQRAYAYFLYKKEDTAERLKPLETLSDGYALAEIDAERRGMGDAFGAAQSGNCYALPDVDYKKLIEWVNEDLGLMQPSSRRVA